MIRSLIRAAAAPLLTTLVAAAFVLPLTGCTTPDTELGLAHAQNLALAQATPVDPSRPMEGGSAVRGAFAQKRYMSGNTRPLATPPAPRVFEPTFSDAEAAGPK